MTGAACEARPFPWRDLMRLFLGERAMAPADFWSLSIPELVACLGAPDSAAPSRSDLKALMEAFPDGR